jgi:hypothetical protein
VLAATTNREMARLCRARVLGGINIWWQQLRSRSIRSATEAARLVEWLCHMLHRMHAARGSVPIDCNGQWQKAGCPPTAAPAAGSSGSRTGDQWRL